MKLSKQEYCKKCDKVTTKRYTKTTNYYRCTICAEECSKKHRRENWLRYIAQKANARKRPGSDKMTEALLQVIMLRQGRRCALTKLPFDMKYEGHMPSLDRIDSSIGYTEDNVQLVLKRVNQMKREFGQDEFVSICANVYIGQHLE